MPEDRIFRQTPIRDGPGNLEIGKFAVRLFLRQQLLSARTSIYLQIRGERFIRTYITMPQDQMSDHIV